MDKFRIGNPEEQERSGQMATVDGGLSRTTGLAGPARGIVRLSSSIGSSVLFCAPGGCPGNLRGHGGGIRVHRSDDKTPGHGEGLCPGVLPVA